MSEGVPRSGGIPLGLFWTPSCVKERAMNRAWLEEEVRVQFGSQRAALVAALHEVQVCVESPECYAAILQMYPDETPNGAIRRVAPTGEKKGLTKCQGPATRIR